MQVSVYFGYHGQDGGRAVRVVNAPVVDRHRGGYLLLKKEEGISLLGA
jgi:hypothetical protein